MSIWTNGRFIATLRELTEKSAYGIKPFSKLDPATRFEGIVYDDESKPQVLSGGAVLMYPVVGDMRSDELHHDILWRYGQDGDAQYVIRAVVNTEADDVFVEVLGDFDEDGEPGVDICIRAGTWRFL